MTSAGSDFPAASLADCVEIAPGVLMPWVGLGTYRSAEGAEVEHEVEWGLELGYRGIDTASLYGNEEGIGHALRRSGIPRDDVFVATKVWNSEQGYDNTLQACADSLGPAASRSRRPVPHPLAQPDA